MDLQLLKPPHIRFLKPFIYGEEVGGPTKKTKAVKGLTNQHKKNKPTQKPAIQTAKPVTKQNRTEDWERKKDDGQIIVALRLAQSVMVV